MSIFEEYKQFHLTNIPKAPMLCGVSGENVRLRMLKLKSKSNELVSNILDKVTTLIKSSNYIIGLASRTALTAQNKAKRLYSSLSKSPISLYKTWYFLDFGSFTQSQYNNSPPFGIQS